MMVHEIVNQARVRMHVRMEVQRRGVICCNSGIPGMAAMILMTATAHRTAKPFCLNHGTEKQCVAVGLLTTNIS